jgi:hypothetical protein
MTDNQKYWIWFAASLAVALLGSVAPVRQMPLDYKAMLWKSIPLAISWGLILGFCVWNYKERGATENIFGSPSRFCTFSFDYGSGSN